MQNRVAAGYPYNPRLIKGDVKNGGSSKRVVVVMQESTLGRQFSVRF